MALWKALPQFRGASSERTYVYRVAHNTALRFVTSRQRRAAREHDAPAAEPVAAANPERDAIRNQHRQRLGQAVQELPVIDRQVMLLHLEGLSTAEIVDVTGYTEGAVAMRLTRARRKLAERLQITEGAR